MTKTILSVKYPAAGKYLLELTLSERVYKMEKVINIAVIGAGLRSRVVVNALLSCGRENIKIVSIFDPDKERAEALKTTWIQPDAVITDSAEDAVKCDGVDWVMIFSPNAFHREHIEMSFAAGKHVFSEKPLATSIEDCQAINEAHSRSGKFFATGFVLRYSPLYVKVKELLDSGKLGAIMSIEANENIAPGHGGYIMTNWRRLSKLSGPHILEKCCHDLDLIEWFTGSLPGKVMAFADKRFFTAENAFLMEKYSDVFLSWPDPHRVATPFGNDSDMDDMISTVAQFRNGVLVTFNAAMCNVLPERRMRFNCQLGTLEVELYSMRIRYKCLGDEAEQVINFGGSDGHAGGDRIIMQHLLDTMVKEVPPQCSGKEGLCSAVYALSLDKAAHEKAIIDLEPVWESLGF